MSNKERHQFILRLLIGMITIHIKDPFLEDNTSEDDI